MLDRYYQGQDNTEHSKLVLNFIVNANPGQLLPEERQQIISTYQAGLLSKETAIALLAYTDSPIAELEKIRL